MTPEARRQNKELKTQTPLKRSSINENVMASPSGSLQVDPSRSQPKHNYKYILESQEGELE